MGSPWWSARRSVMCETSASVHVPTPPRPNPFAVHAQLWNLMPMDPMSWVVLYNAHHDALADLIASNMRHRLPPETLRQTPAASVRAPRRRWAAAISR